MASIFIAEDFTSQISQIIRPSKSHTGGLYLGNYSGSQNQALLEKYRITAVISILSEREVKLPKSITSHLKVQINDNPFQNISQHFPVCFDFIDKKIKYGNVLVHCVAGISRSATIIIGFIMKTKNYTLSKALKKIKQKRTQVNPNKGFVLQLNEYEKIVLKQPKIKQP